MANKKRKPLSKSVRFEVFKRDSFTCQYCGRTAPDVILEVDHIVPVAKGGTDEILNLVTSCRECNRGKSAKTLDDTSAVALQRAELEKLEQQKMMLDWKRELLNIVDDQVEYLDEFLIQTTPYGMSDSAKIKIKRLISQYGFNEVEKALKIAFTRYFRFGGSYEEKSWGEAFRKIGGICYNRRIAKNEEDD